MSLTDPRGVGGSVQWFTMTESLKTISASLGPPRMVAHFGKDFESYQYQIGSADSHEYSHQIVFRRSGELVSVTRNYEPERLVDEFFPAAETTVYCHPDPAVSYCLRLRRLSGGRLLLAMGSARAGIATGQLVLIRDSEVRSFYPWLAERLTGATGSRRTGDSNN